MRSDEPKSGQRVLIAMVLPNHHTHLVLCLVVYERAWKRHTIRRKGFIVLLREQRIQLGIRFKDHDLPVVSNKFVQWPRQQRTYHAGAARLRLR